MKKVIRLTESDLARIVKRVIKEQAPTDVYNQSSMGRVSNEPRMGRAKNNEFDWKSHFDQIKNELDSYLNTIEGPVNIKRFQNKVMNTYYQMVSNVDDEYSYPSHGRDFQRLTTDFMSYFTNKLKELIQNYGKLTESDLARIVKRVINEQDEITPQMIISMLMKEAESTPQEDYDDVYDWMQDIFSPVELKLQEMGYEDYDDIRMEYDDVIMGLWEQKDDDNMLNSIAMKIMSSPRVREVEVNMDPSEYEDEFEYADNFFYNLLADHENEDYYDDLMEYIKDEFSELIFSFYFNS